MLRSSQSLSVDLRFAGYATTIGCAEFHEMKVNRLNFELLLKKPGTLVGTPGRKPKVQRLYIWHWVRAPTNVATLDRKDRATWSPP